MAPGTPRWRRLTARRRRGTFTKPMAVAVAAAIVLVSSVIVATPPASAATLLNMWGAKGTANGQFDNPSAIAVSSLGEVYVADTSNSRIQEFNANGVWIRSFHSAGSGQSQFNYPMGIATGPDQAVYVLSEVRTPGCDGRCASVSYSVNVFNAGGIYLRTWSTARSNAIAVSGSGLVYVLSNPLNQTANSACCTVVNVFNTSGALQRSWGVDVGAVGTTGTGSGMAVGVSGDVYVASSSANLSNVQRYSPAGAVLGRFGSEGIQPGQFKMATAIATGPNPYQDVFVLDQSHNQDIQSGRVQQFEANGKWVTQWLTVGGQKGWLQPPLGVAVNPRNHEVYIANNAANRILRYSPN
jgi:hypothetical protein